MGLGYFLSLQCRSPSKQEMFCKPNGDRQ
jgi:hypothetical protein